MGLRHEADMGEATAERNSEYQFVVYVSDPTTPIERQGFDFPVDRHVNATRMLGMFKAASNVGAVVLERLYKENARQKFPTDYAHGREVQPEIVAAYVFPADDFEVQSVNLQRVHESRNNFGYGAACDLKTGELIRNIAFIPPISDRNVENLDSRGRVVPVRNGDLHVVIMENTHLLPMAVKVPKLDLR